MVTLKPTLVEAQRRRLAQLGRVALIAKPGNTNTGVGRYTHTLQMELQAAGVVAQRIAPDVPPLPEVGYTLLRRAGLDARTFLMNYPLWARYPATDVYHLMSQNLASLLLFQRPRGNVVVTVHDIIPFMLRNNQQFGAYRSAAERFFDRLAMAGLRRADYLIADSHYTKHCLECHLNIAPERIQVVPLGIDHAQFQPVTVTAALRERHGLPEGHRYLISVGSEDPRKNLDTLIAALAAVRRTVPNVELIKVGRAHFIQERQKLIGLADQLGIRSAIHWLDDVPESDLAALYSLADVCAMPSLYEGFGFPVLESMACGTPVVCMNAASLPELIGAAGLLVPNGPHAVADFAAALLRLLCDEQASSALREAGYAQAARFQWAATASQMVDIYQSLCNQGAA